MKVISVRSFWGDHGLLKMTNSFDLRLVEIKRMSIVLLIMPFTSSSSRVGAFITSQRIACNCNFARPFKFGLEILLVFDLGQFIGVSTSGKDLFFCACCFGVYGCL